MKSIKNSRARSLILLIPLIPLIPFLTNEEYQQYQEDQEDHPSCMRAPEVIPFHENHQPSTFCEAQTGAFARRPMLSKNFEQTQPHNSIIDVHLPDGRIWKCREDELLRLHQLAEDYAGDVPIPDSLDRNHVVGKMKSFAEYLFRIGVILPKPEKT